MATIRKEDKPDGTLATATRIVSGRVFGNIIVQAALVFLALMWTIPTGGLLISSFRTPNAIRQTGWWTIFTGAETINSSLELTSSANNDDALVTPGESITVSVEDSTLLSAAVEGFPEASINSFRIETVTGIATVEEFGEPIDIDGVGTITVTEGIGLELDGEGDYEVYSMTDLNSLNIEELPYTFEYDLRAVLPNEREGSITIEQFGEPVQVEDIGTLTVRRNGSFTFEAADGFNGAFDPSINSETTLEAPYEVDYEILTPEVQVVQGSVEIESLGEEVTIEDFATVELSAIADSTFEPTEGFDGFIIPDLDEPEEVPYDFEYELSGVRNIDETLNITRPNIAQTVPQIGSFIVFEDGTWAFEPRGNFEGTFTPTIPEDFPLNEQFDIEYTATRSGGVLASNNTGETMAIAGVGSLSMSADGGYEFTANENFEGQIDLSYEIVEPLLTLNNYNSVLFSDGMGQAFLNSLTLTIPATIIPISIAAFASYAFSWMEFPGRRILFVIVVGLQVVPLHLALIPMLRIYTSLGINGTFLAMWLAHTGFGMPLAIFLLRNYIGNLPRELIESASIDGASHFTIFVRLILPLSVPALAAFSIFQFLWVWNDLIVALVFLGNRPVVTSRLAEMVGSRGQDWHVLTAGAFVSMALPLLVFFSLQRYFVRGLLAGSVKGG